MCATRSQTIAEEKAGLPIISFADAAAFGRWLARQTADAPGLWLKLAKKGNEASSLTRAQAVEEALCHGWIDGQINGYDEAWWLVRFTPRKARSQWSQINRDTVRRLLEQERMRPAGLAQVKAAQADGRWDAAYAPQSLATVPPDLQAALDANPKARRFFETLKGANRYAVLYRVQSLKRPESRAKRIEEYVAMLARGETIHPLLGKKPSSKKP
jgi:uncharacterized protein YdeI (YjbR/CyaY-like superfamily)